jgi:hypothetical protein
MASQIGLYPIQPGSKPGLPIKETDMNNYDEYDAGDEWNDTPNTHIPKSVIVADYEGDGWWAVSIVSFTKNGRRAITVIDRDREIHTLVRRVVAQRGIDGNNIMLSPIAAYVTTMVLLGEKAGMKV